MADEDKQHAFMSVQLKGDNDDAILNNYNKNVGEDGTTVKEALNIDGIEVQQAGLQPLASELTGTIGEDQRRAEVAAIPLVAVVLFFVAWALFGVRTRDDLAGEVRRGNMFEAPV